MNRMNRLLNCPLWCALLSLAVARVGLAQPAALWPPADQLGQYFTYGSPNNPPPYIDALAFDNENTFIINFVSIVANPQVFETWDTLNYTNNGLMEANSPISTNGVFLQIAPGCGYNFDTVSTSTGFHSMAGTFYNPGTVRVNSVLDTGANFYSLFTAGIFKVSATNIINHGTVSVGQNGQMQFGGQRVNLARSQLNLENLDTLVNVLSSTYSGLNFLVPLNLNVLAASVAHETNVIIPSVQFSLPNPTSDFFIPPLLGLKNATAYVNDSGVIASNRLVRAVFISNIIPNVTNNVYFNDGFGDILVQWAGSYLDPISGVQNTNYMYLEDNFGEITNLQVNAGGGGPVNYGWLSQWPFGTGVAAAPGLPPGTFKSTFITNEMAYESAQLIATTVGTNVSLQYPFGTITNLPGRIQINASSELDMALAQITGPNYLSLTCTNQFDGSSGASIFAPYSDINLGVTNGFMSVSNLLSPSVPNWNGPAQVFSARWTVVDAFGVTNTYHVMLLNSQVVPTTPPVVQNLTLHSTNLFISDIFNVIGKLSIDATTLNVTTNLNTDGFGSQDGELNWYGPTALGTTQLPNLHWVTNNGAIRAANLAVFGSAANIYGAFVNNGLVADQGTTIYTTNFLSSGVISNGAGNFYLNSQTATLTNGTLTALGDVTITTGSLLTSNLQMQVGRALTLQVSGSLTDTGPSSTNASIWTVGGVHSANYGVGFSLPILPTNAPIGDLLGTTITNVCWTNYAIFNTWAGLDRGYSNSGYTNNAALGRLVLDPLWKNSQINFTGPGASNAIYVDSLVLMDQATNLLNSLLPEVVCSPNFVIYYAQAFQNGVSVAEKLNHANSDHFRWMPTYVGYFSSTNLVYPPGVTNTFNAALAQSTLIDSDSDGTVNALDSTPFLVPQQLNFSVLVTNRPPPSVRLQWTTIPRATNFVYYKTNFVQPGWIMLTNFPSPQIYNPTPGTDNYQQARVSVFDALTNAPRYYQIEVNPWLLAP